MSDAMVRALAFDDQVRVSAVVDTALVQELCQRHGTWPVASAALGRAVSSALLLTWGLKGEGMLTLRIFGDGPLGGVIVTANAAGEAKGYVQEPHVDLPLTAQGKLDVGGAIGQGDLYISKDIGLGEPYTGSVPLLTGEVGDDVAGYLMQSEQTPSLVAVGVLVDTDLSIAASGGVIIQAMPGADEAILSAIERSLASVRPVSTLVKEGYGPAELIQHYLAEGQPRILETTPVTFKCSCSRERISGLLKSLGRDELTAMMEKDEQAEVACHFCGEHYQFSKDELAALLAEDE